MSSSVVCSLSLVVWSLSSVDCSLSSVNIFKHHLLWNRWADWSQISCGASMGWGNESLFARARSDDQTGRHAYIRLKPFKHLLLLNQWADCMKHGTLVCSTGDSSKAYFVPMMTLEWPRPILGQGQIYSHRLLYGKKSKTCIFQKLLQPVTWKLVDAVS